MKRKPKILQKSRHSGRNPRILQNRHKKRGTQITHKKYTKEHQLTVMSNRCRADRW